MTLSMGFAGRGYTIRSALRPAVRFNSTKTPSTKYTKVTHPQEDAATLPTSSTKHIINTYARPSFILSHGKGSWVYTTNGDRYLDFTAGIAVTALGHGDEEFAKVMGEQAAKLVHTSNVFHNDWAGKLADLIVGLTKRDGGLGWAPGSGENAGEAKVFFSNSGTEANEGAFKFARKIAKEKWAAKTGRDWAESPKTRFACFENAFHGRSMGALSATSNPKYQKPFEPLIPGFDVGVLNDIDALQTLVTEDTCGVIVEVVQGEGGLAACKEEWLRALRKRCDEVDAVLIFDEIQAGLYRTGSLWAHSTLPTDCHPDIVTMAKPLANGYPIGAILVKEHLTQAITVGSHGTTFGGSPLATRLGHHVLSRLSAPDFISNLRTVASHLNYRLLPLPDFFPSILQRQVRGQGFLTGLGFKNPDDPTKLQLMARERGLLVLTAGKDALRLVPSLNVKQEEVDHAVDVLESCLTIMNEEKTS